jgi:hypothetical protein
VAIRFAAKPLYLDILVGCIVAIVSLIMLCVSIEAPAPIISRLEGSRFGEHLFTFRGRYMVDLIIALFLFAMGLWGIIVGICTLALIFGIRFVGVKQPEAFNEIFRQSDIESTGDTYTLDDSEGGGGR